MKPKFFLILGVFLICINSVYAEDFVYNVSSVPFNATKEVLISVSQTDLPDNITVSYDAWLLGDKFFDLQTVNFFKHNVSISVPDNVSDRRYTSVVNYVSGKGKRLQIGFVFDVNISKPSPLSNVSVTCRFDPETQETICKYYAIGVEPKKEIITIYNTSSVISCNDLYANDYQQLWNEKLNLQTDYDKTKADYQNFTKMVLRGCSDEKLALDNCYRQKADQERRTTYRLPDDYCLPYSVALDNCNINKEAIENQAVSGLNVMHKGKYYIVLGLLLTLGVVDFIFAIKHKIKLRMGGI